MKALGGEILAVSHESVANNVTLIARHDVPFLMLADTSRQTIRAYDTVDPILGIAKIAFFVIDRDGVIRWKSTGHSNVDPNDLPEWDEIRAALESL